MSNPVISSISPASGAPGAAITVSGSGFIAAAQIGCPSFVPTTFVSAGSLTAVIPAMEGTPGGSQLVAVFVLNPDGSVSNAVNFSVQFPRSAAQSWTDIDRVCGEVPAFTRGVGNITDATIIGWIQSISQSVTSVLLKRGLPLDPSQWQQADTQSASPSAAATLELITRYGAAARLVAAIASQFSGGTNALATNLERSYNREFQALVNGDYDKLFQPSAATEITGQSVGTSVSGGDSTCPVFRMDQRF